VEEGQPEENFWRIFGRKFAEMHAYSVTGYGFPRLGYIGSNPQINQSHFQESWADFFIKKRLQFQIELAERSGHLSTELERLYRSFESRAWDLLSQVDESPSLLHGDLWS